jgi:hypothetical protein
LASDVAIQERGRNIGQLRTGCGGYFVGHTGHRMKMLPRPDVM